MTIDIPDSMLYGASQNATVKKPGDFRRRGPDGPPWVASSDKTRKPKGNKPELLDKARAAGHDLPDKITVPELVDLLGPEPADELYGRPSGYGELIDDAWAIRKWGERQVALGIAMEPSILRELDNADDERKALDRIAMKAHDIAGSDIGAARGTWVHLVTEWAEGDWAKPGPPPDERYGLPMNVGGQIAHGWLRLLADNGLEVVASELPVVNDEVRLAGTLDRIVRLNRDLAFNGVVVPAGSLVVLDVKTSKLHADDDELPSFWSSYPIQIATYAAAVPYDTERDVRLTWDEVLT